MGNANSVMAADSMQRIEQESLNAASIVFHVIYVHDAVRTLLPLLDTLLCWSDCRYCLVANGCDGDELALLRTRCDGEPRLSLLVLPGPEVLGHGAVLNHLYACTAGDTFCFMDSDILAVGDFLAALLPHLPGAAGVFSAWPLSIKASERVLPDNSNHLIGHHSITHSGVHLGGTYLAIYDRAALAVGMAAVPGGFKGCLWSELSEATRAILEEVGQVRTQYDTGRVLNLCLLQRGYRLHVEHTSTLCHLGNYSDPFLRAAATPLNGSYLHRLAGRLRRDVVRLADRMRGRKQAPSIPPLPALKIRKRRIHAYFAAVTRALDAGQPLPPLLQVGDAEIDLQIAQATAHLVALNRSPQRAQRSEA